MSKPILRTIVLVVILLALIAVAIVWFTKPKQKLPSAVKIDTTNQPTMGNTNAKVHIVAFEDLKCFNCKRYSNRIFPVIKKKFIDTGIAKYTFINVAFIPGSAPVANAARCIYAQDKSLFFPFIEYVYQHQPPENVNWATIPKLMAMASHIKGVNSQKLSTCLVNSPYDSFIQQNLNTAMKVMGNTVATPSVYVNGVKVDPLTFKQVSKLVKRFDK